MSLELAAWNTPPFHRTMPARPRMPLSSVLVTTCSRGGSPVIAFGSLHGAPGSAHPSSIEVGARLPSLYPAYTLVDAEALKVRPMAGLSRSKACWPSSDPDPPPG